MTVVWNFACTRREDPRDGDPTSSAWGLITWFVDRVILRTPGELPWCSPSRRVCGSPIRKVGADNLRP